MSRKKKDHLILLEGQVANPPKLELTFRDIAYIDNLDDYCFTSAGYLKWKAEFEERKDACIQEWRETATAATLF